MSQAPFTPVPQQVTPDVTIPPATNLPVSDLREFAQDYYCAANLYANCGNLDKAAELRIKADLFTAEMALRKVFHS